MSIYLYTGVPGAGKSYRVVHDIIDRIESEDCIILHNIEDFRYESPDIHDISNDLQSGCLHYQQFQLFLDKYRLDAKRKIYLIIDECQRYLPYELRCSETVYTFDYHRHHNIDIYLVSQHSRKISPRIASLVEEEIRAVNPRVSVMPGKFSYKHMIGGEIYKKSHAPKNKEIFALYKSQRSGKPKSVGAYRWVIILAILVIGGGLTFYFALFRGIGRSLERDKQEYIAELQSRQPGQINPVNPVEIVHPDRVHPADRGDPDHGDPVDVSVAELSYPLPDFVNWSSKTVQYTLAGRVRIDTIDEYLSRFSGLHHEMRYFYAPFRDLLYIFDVHGSMLWPESKRLALSDLGKNPVTLPSPPQQQQEESTLVIQPYMPNGPLIRVDDVLQSGSKS